MTDRRTRDALNNVTDQMERLRAAVQESDDLEIEDAFDDLAEAMNQLKLAIGAMLVPKELKFEPSGGVKAMTDEQIERGIELIQEILAQREAEANAKVIEGEAEVVPSLPAPGSGGTKMPKA